MIENLTPAQQIFSVFYAIFFGIMLQTVGARRTNASNLQKENNHDITLNLFDTPNAWAIGFRYDNKPFWRLLFSIFFLNVIPGVIFAIVFLGLKNLANQIDWAKILIIIWISLIPHYIYRIYIAVVVLFSDGLYLKSGEYDKYNPYDINAKALILKDRKQYEGHKSFFNHFAFPFFIVFPSNIILYNYLVPNQVNSIFYWISLILIFFGLFLFILPRKLN